MYKTKIQNHHNRGAAKRNHFVALSAILAILLGWGSTAEARTEIVRWTLTPADIAGFRLYSSSTPGSGGSTLMEDLAVAEAGPNQQGEYFFAIDITDQATVYITISAYNDDNLESFRSGEQAYAPPPPPPPAPNPDRDGDGVLNENDAFPDDPNESQDSDLDGVGDNADVFPNDPSEWADADDDGTGDNADVFPNDPSESDDSDGDGVGDNADVFPNDPSQFEITLVLSPYRVNAGDTQDRDLADGRKWTRDVGFWSAGIANAIDPNTEIAATTTDELYRSSRTDPDDGDEMLWSFPLTNGSYTLRLHFAENIHNATGQRVFNVDVEGIRALTNFDIFAEAGGVKNRMVQKIFNVEVTDGVLEVLFMHLPGSGDPTVMGIEVVGNQAIEGPLLTTPGKPFLIDVN